MVFFVIEIKSRAVEIAGIAVDPGEAWMNQVARNLTDPVDGFLRSAKHMIHDRDPLFTEAFIAILEAGGVKSANIPAHSPNCNSYAERFVKTIKYECLNHFVIFGERHLRHLIKEFVEHYMTERFHQGIGGQLIRKQVGPTNGSPRLRDFGAVPDGRDGNAEVVARHTTDVTRLPTTPFCGGSGTRTTHVCGPACIGVLSSHAASRSKVVPSPVEQDKPKNTLRHISWSELLRPTVGFEIVCTKSFLAAKLLSESRMPHADHRRTLLIAAIVLAAACGRSGLLPKASPAASGGAVGGGNGGSRSGAGGSSDAAVEPGSRPEVGGEVGPETRSDLGSDTAASGGSGGIGGGTGGGFAGGGGSRGGAGGSSDGAIDRGSRPEVGAEVGLEVRSDLGPDLTDARKPDPPPEVGPDRQPDATADARDSVDRADSELEVDKDLGDDTPVEAGNEVGGEAGGATLELLAGGIGEEGDVDGVGAAARFHWPCGVASDGAGNLFVADRENETIRQVVIATGAVTTLAGSPGLDGTADGTGSDARFSIPLGVALDGAGNLFVGDFINHTIRKVVIATRIVTTLAGAPSIPGMRNGTGSDARFNYPAGLAVDGTGNLFVADSDNYAIRKVVIATGEVTTLAGSGASGSTDGTGTAAQFGSLGGLAFDGAGNLFVGDPINNKIRKVVIATRAVTTFAGSGAPGSVDGSGTAAQFYYPFGIASDGAGNLYVADYRNHTIRKIVIATAAVSTVVGTAGRAGVVLGPLPGGLDSPEQLAVGPAGELFIVDVQQNALLVTRF
jgi:hypothetical protein